MNHEHFEFERDLTEQEFRFVQSFLLFAIPLAPFYLEARRRVEDGRWNGPAADYALNAAFFSGFDLRPELAIALRIWDELPQSSHDVIAPVLSNLP